jgi:hypothetical protein
MITISRSRFANTLFNHELLYNFIQELVEVLKELESVCPTKSDYSQLCALVTLPKLMDHADFKSWNPSSARVECFQKVCFV